MAYDKTLTRPIVNIEHRTPYEEFAIMCDRINAAKQLTSAHGVTDEMVDKAMVECSNLHPPLRRSDCARLLKAALQGVGECEVVKVGWRCPECSCTEFARCDERKPDGTFGPASIVRCVNCKLEQEWPPTPQEPAASEYGPNGSLRNTHLLDWLQDAYEHCQDGTKDWCEDYLNNARDVIRGYDIDYAEATRIIAELRAERDGYKSALETAEDSIARLERKWRHQTDRAEKAEARVKALTKSIVAIKDRAEEDDTDSHAVLEEIAEACADILSQQGGQTNEA